MKYRAHLFGSVVRQRDDLGEPMHVGMAVRQTCDFGSADEAVSFLQERGNGYVLESADGVEWHPHCAVTFGKVIRPDQAEAGTRTVS
jgi:hypothetical protein